jgi:uncharacterized protein
MRPLGRPAFDLEVVTLGIDELEALRLADLEGLYQEAAAERMGISRPTFARVLNRARATVIDALVNEKLLLVAGGSVVEAESDGSGCPVHWGGRRRGRGCHCPHRHVGDPQLEMEGHDPGLTQSPEGESNAD